ncbi:MAG: succinate dehydrogenase cytochrome b subunit [Bacteroidia bacterium]
MSNAKMIFAYSIGKKLVMALTGLFLVSFLVIHLLGNLQLFTGNAKAFNDYTQFMTTSPLIKASEFILLAGFLLHILFAVRLTQLNASARPEKYANHKESASSSWASRNMGMTGSVILLFLIMHLVMFWGKFHYASGEMTPAKTALAETWKVTADVKAKDGAVLVGANQYVTKENIGLLEKEGIVEVPALSMFKITALAFKEWWIVLLYVAGMALLGFHLNHGFQSAFRTLGLIHKKYTPLIEKAGLAFCIIIPLLFALIPVYYLVAG